jgi:hypothetical protein
VVGGTASTTTDASGAYALTLGAGTFTLQVEAAGYVPETAVIEIVAGQTTTQDFALRAESPAQTRIYLPLVAR